MQKRSKAAIESGVSNAFQRLAEQQEGRQQRQEQQRLVFAELLEGLEHLRTMPGSRFSYTVDPHLNRVETNVPSSPLSTPHYIKIELASPSYLKTYYTGIHAVSGSYTNVLKFNEVYKIEDTLADIAERAVEAGLIPAQQQTAPKNSAQAENKRNRFTFDLRR
jgi:hypothetical protein